MTKQILVGGVPVGGGAPVTIQSMTNTPTSDVEATVAQIRRLAAAGCQIVRVAVPDMAAAKAVGAIKEQIDLPLVVDIHFDYRLALECIEAGADKVRINPGNIGGEDRVKAVAMACARKHIPIRIGVNGGSLEKPLLAKYGGVTPQALVDSAFGHIALLNRYDFDDICVSLKSSSVPIAMQAYQLMHEQSHYPLHLGVTEAGTTHMGTLKSAAGIGGLLAGLRFVRERRPEELLAEERALTALAARGLRQLPGVEVFTGPGQSGVLSFRCRDLDCEEAAACLAEAGIAVRAGLHCAPMAHRSGGTLETGTVRVSFSAFNTSAEVRQFLQVCRTAFLPG